MPNIVWDEITYPFPNFNGVTFEDWERISNFTPHYIMDKITYPCLGLKLTNALYGHLICLTERESIDDCKTAVNPVR